MILRHHCKRKRILQLITVLFLTIQISISAQESLIDKFKGVKINWELKTKDNIPLDVTNQILIKKRARGGNYSSDRQLFISYGFESIHLEFSTNNDIEERTKKGRKWKYYVIEFYNDLGESIGELEISKAYVRKFITDKNDSTQSFLYSFDLNGIPILMLEEIKSVKIVEIDRSPRYR